MKKSALLLLLKSIVILITVFTSTAKADVYIDLSDAAEINISNVQVNQHYTLKIEEPIAPHTLKTMATVINPQNMSILPFNSEVVIAANESDIEPALIHAVIAVESHHNPKAQSRKGAYGLMQLMPETSKRFNVANKNDPKQNVMAGAKYLRELLNIFNGDINLTLAAYNAGPNAVLKYGGKIPPYKETLDYVPKVLKYYRQYSYIQL